MIQWSSLKQKIQKWSQRLESHSGLIWFASAALILIVSLVSQSDRPATHTEASSAELGIDTFIPKGQVLVPITVQNFESLDSVFGQFGFVDLYSVQADGKRRKEPDARSVKLLRAPKNPQQFGILIPSSRSAAIVQAGAEFFVVVRSQQSGTEIEMPPTEMTKRRPRVVYEEGDAE